MESASPISNQFDQEGQRGRRLRATSSSPFFRRPIQAKLTVNQPDDKYEQEAEAVADKLMRMTEPSTEAPFFKPAAIHVHRKCAHCAEEEKKLHRKDTILPTHTNGPVIQKQDGGAPVVPATPCPASVSIGTLAQFNHSNLSAADKESWPTYLGVASQMNVGPGPDHSRHCMKERLTTISNNCPAQVYSRGGTESAPCTGNRCLDINSAGSAGDGATHSMVSDGPTSFIDLHRTRNHASLLEGSGVSSCSVVCDQVYSCDRTHATTGRFTITRNFQAGTQTKADGTTIHITTGNVTKQNATP